LLVWIAAITVALLVVTGLYALFPARRRLRHS
jgi:hypothetical protein